MTSRFRKLLIAVPAMLGLAVSAAMAQPKTFVTIGSGSTTGLYYPTAVGIAKIVNEAGIPVRANARSTGGSVFNAKAIGQGQLQMALMQNNIAQYAYTGEGVEAFQGQPIQNIRGVAALYPEVIHLVAREDANISSPADLKGKRVYVGDVGSGTEADARNILGAYDMTLDDLQTAVRGSAGDAVNLLRDDRIDAMFYTVGVGAGAITEAAQTAPITIVPIEAETASQLQQNYAFYTPFTIPANAYPGQEEEVSTITMKAMLAADANLPEEAVYQFTKTVFGDKLDAFHNEIQNPNLKQYFTVESAVEGMPIPLHPGAERFFREAGVTIPDNIQAAQAQ